MSQPENSELYRLPDEPEPIEGEKIDILEHPLRQAATLEWQRNQLWTFYNQYDGDQQDELYNIVGGLGEVLTSYTWNMIDSVARFYGYELDPDSHMIDEEYNSQLEWGEVCIFRVDRSEGAEEADYEELTQFLRYYDCEVMNGKEYERFGQIPDDKERVFMYVPDRLRFRNENDKRMPEIRPRD